MKAGAARSQIKQKSPKKPIDMPESYGAEGVGRKSDDKKCINGLVKEG